MSELREPTLYQMMKHLGERGIAVLIRFDPLREFNHFTICVGSERLCDTDAPVSELKQYIRKQYRKWDGESAPYWAE